MQDGSNIQQEELVPLETQERRIFDISKQLTSLLQGYTTTVISLARHCALTSTNCAFGPQIPDEIIVHILEYIVEDSTHHIKPLLLVNRRFHDVIMSTPVLWSKLTIVVDKRLQEVNGLSTTYLNVCLERSREAKLDVKLDFSLASGIYEYFESIQEELRRTLPSSALLLATGDSQFKWIDTDPGYTEELEKTKELVETLAAQMTKWQSASILFPSLDEEGELTAAFWRLFLSPASKFTGGIIQAYCQNGFPHLSHIKHCTLWGPSEIGKITLNSGTLRELYFEASSEDSSLYKLSSCTDLQVLTIRVHYDNVNPSSSPLPVSLPSLLELSLIGQFDGLMGIEFQVPRLTTLTLKDWTIHVQYLPQVRPRYVYWTVDARKMTDLQLVEWRLDCLLEEYTEMETLTIDHLASIQGGVEMVSEMMQGRDSLPSLQSVEFTHDDRAIATLHRDNDWMPYPQ
ncbi:hypothetical protein FRC17_000975 [Serendipita sp. 399]|nr:hypothetical protein FRC17_000975 [Serendipita sp. 399]